MAGYFIRICFPYDFVRKMTEEKKDPVLRLKAKFPNSSSPELIHNRYTYGLFRMTAGSAAECGQIVSRAWKECFPDEDCEPFCLTAEDDGGDGGALMRSIYSGYYGADDYLRLVTELYGSLPLLKEVGALKAARMQSYVFACDPGGGFTTLLSSFGDFLHRMHVYGENDEKKTNYTEYTAGKETAGGVASADDIYSALREQSAIEENNVIGIDIGYFVESGKHDELRRFINRLYRLQDDYVFVFRIPFLEKKALDDFIGVLSDVMLIRPVRIPPLHDMVLLEHMWDELYQLGYAFDNELTDTFFELIRAEKKDGRFYGFKTVSKIVHEMVLNKASKDAEKLRAGGEVEKKMLRPRDIDVMAETKKAEKTGFEELAELIGMEKIAERIREITAQVRLSMTDERLDRPCIHMRFTGAPGTGKTTVARIIGKIFREAGILRKGAFIEYSARSLCAEYVGQTAVKTAAICREAYGSVLFIDEAYSLYEDGPKNNDYGKEALTTLISEMENHRDDMLVIMAGYTDDMETLMKGNAGLRSRMPYMIHFPNYTRRQLFEIYMLMVRKHFDYEPELEKAAEEFFAGLPEQMLDSREFANARFVRNLYERTWSKGSLRASLSGTDKIRLTRADFIAASSEDEFSEMPEKTVRVGFNKN